MVYILLTINAGIVPLTPSNVLRAVGKVDNWLDDEGLGYWLFIPSVKRVSIRHKFLNKSEQKRQMVDYWMTTDPLASWRRLITALDWMGETEVADSIRSNAEPLPGLWVIVAQHSIMSLNALHGMPSNGIKILCQTHIKVCHRMHFAMQWTVR